MRALRRRLADALARFAGRHPWFTLFRGELFGVWLAYRGCTGAYPYVAALYFGCVLLAYALGWATIPHLHLATSEGERNAARDALLDRGWVASRWPKGRHLGPLAVAITRAPGDVLVPGWVAVAEAVALPACFQHPAGGCASHCRSPRPFSRGWRACLRWAWGRRADVPAVLSVGGSAAVCAVYCADVPAGQRAGLA